MYEQAEFEQTSYYGDQAYVDGPSLHYEEILNDSYLGDSTQYGAKEAITRQSLPQNLPPPKATPEGDRSTQWNIPQQSHFQKEQPEGLRSLRAFSGSVVDQAPSREPRNEGHRIRLKPISQLRTKVLLAHRMCC